MTQDITVTDLFCGAGGSSIGAEAAGARLRMAANHWRLAIETHNANFPDADHDCADVSQVDPRRYPRTDILIASPECTNHSSAKSRKTRATIWDPKADADGERSRATMWDVVRFSEHHRYQVVVVENVVEATRWEPFGAWLAAMQSLGYAHRLVSLNSFTAHPTPQSRDRMYVVFHRRGNPAPDLDFTPTAWCATCGHDVAGVQSWKNPARAFGKYRSQYVYRCPSCASVATPYAWPAASAIDWSIDAPRIGDRDRPLADATLARIRAGLERYGAAAIVQAAGHTYERPGYYRTWPLWQPLGTQAATAQHALVVDLAYGHEPRPASEPHAAQTAQARSGVIVGINFSHSGDSQHRQTAEPMPTQTAQQGHALVVPLRANGEALPVDAPVPTVAAAGNHHALLVDYHGQGQPQPVAAPHRTMDTRDRYGLVRPAVDVEDCGFRMLEPHEIGRAMAFPETYEVRGNKRDRVRQYGNAVTPPVMAKILARVIDSLAGAA